jgi:hypothetical protein
VAGTSSSIALLARDAAELTAFGVVYFGLETAVTAAPKLIHPPA